MRHGSGGHVYQPKFKVKGDPDDPKLWTGKGSWRIRYVWKDRATRQRRTLDEKVPCPIGKRAASSHDATAYLRERIAQAVGGTLATTIKAEDLRYEDMRTDLLAYYAEQKRRTLLIGRDGKPYISSLNHLDKFFSGWNALSINHEGLRRFKTVRDAAGASNTSINRSLELLRSMFHRQVRQKRLLLSDVPEFEMLPKAPGRKGVLESKDYPKVLAAMPEQYRYAFVLAYFTGMRKGEIRRLRWDAVDFQKGVFRLYGEETKNGESRCVSIPTELVEWLKITRLKFPEGVYVFGLKDGKKPLGEFQKPWNRACVATGIGKWVEVAVPGKKPRKKYVGLVFHQLRHSAVTRFAEAGVAVHLAMSNSGHNSVEAWKNYNQIQTAALNAAMRKSEEIHATQLAQAKSEQSESENAAKSTNLTN